MSVSQSRRPFPANAALLLSIAAAIVLPASAATPSDARQAFLDRYCASCHSAASKTAGIVLQNSEASNPAARPDLWEKVIRKIKAGEMPPAGMPRPDDASLKRSRRASPTIWTRAARATPYAGRPVIRRLNRLEYANAIRDLLAIELPVKDELPPDGIAAGFDNIGDALSMSPLLLEQYLKVARRVSELAVGTGDPSPVTEIFRAPERSPPGWVRGCRSEHAAAFVCSTTFRLTASTTCAPFSNGKICRKIEGVRFFQTRVKVKAGPHVVIVDVSRRIRRAGRSGSECRRPRGPGAGRAAGYARFRDSSHHRIACRQPPREDSSKSAGMTVGEAAFAGTAGSARRWTAWRSPGLTTRRASVKRRAGGGFSFAGPRLRRTSRPARRRSSPPSPDALSAAKSPRRTSGHFSRSSKPRGASTASMHPSPPPSASVLLAPDFLFRLEFDPPGAAPGSAQKVSEWNWLRGCRFFCGAAFPTTNCWTRRRAGSCAAAALDAAGAPHARRPPRRPLWPTTSPHSGWGCAAWRKSSRIRWPIRNSTAALAAAFEEETRLFVRSIIRENRSVLDLLAADYTYLNERLARLYGIPGVIGPGFRRVSLAADPERGGLLGQGSILLLTSHTTTTSPILRGKWILDSLLNSPPPPPPPTGVPPLEESAGKGEKLTVRQQVERHRNDAACASCHARMDPLGFALENFDVIGRWRTRDEGGEIDASGKLPNGETFSGPQGLEEVAARPPR